jgi:hypothetical protein
MAFRKHSLINGSHSSDIDHRRVGAGVGVGVGIGVAVAVGSRGRLLLAGSV